MSSIEKLNESLYTFLTEERKQRFEEVLNKRTRHIALILEDVYQSRNTSAIMRSADGMGLQDFHIIETIHKWNKNKSVSKGASSWLTLNKYDSIDSCIEKVKSLGYRIVATSPHEGGYTPDTLPLDKPVAIVMGTELNGITPPLMSQVDDYVEIPMHGFSESFNISVASSIITNRLRNRLDEMGIDDGLSDKEKAQLRLVWAYNSLKDPEAILRHLGLELPEEIRSKIL